MSVSAESFMPLSPSEQDLADVLASLVELYECKPVIDIETTTITGPVAIDVEHDEAGNYVCVGVFDGTRSYAFTSAERLLASLANVGTYIAHNGKGDFEQLNEWGFRLSRDQLIHDTMLEAHLADSSQLGYGLKDLAKRELGISYPAYSDLVKDKKVSKTETFRRTLDKWPIEVVANYNALDCYVTYKLYEQQISAKDAVNIPANLRKLVYDCSWVFQRMENRGARVDLTYLAALGQDLEKQLSGITGELNTLVPGVENWDSPKQRLEGLAKVGINGELKGKPSASKPALEKFRDNPIVSKLFNHSEVNTLLKMFVRPYLERGTAVVHPFFNQVGTRTGRLSCSNPNLLQIPKRSDNGTKVRRMFIARDGFVLGDCDFGQIEPRLMAHLSKDPSLCKLFNEGVDFHTYTAESLGITRDRAKVLNLSVGYRATPASVSKQLKCEWDEAEAAIKAWWTQFPQLWAWQEKLIWQTRKDGYFHTLLGRRVRVDGLNDTESYVNRRTRRTVFPKREAAERQLINNIAQASAAEVMQLAMCQVDKAGHAIIIQVYDQLVLELHEDSSGMELWNVKKMMENCIKLDVPLTVDAKFGTSWADVKHEEEPFNANPIEDTQSE